MNTRRNGRNSNHEDTFRLYVRFSTVEYAELDEDLAKYDGPSKAARIRRLLRLGLQAVTGQIHALPGADGHTHLAPVAEMQGGNQIPDSASPRGANAATSEAVVTEPTDEVYDKLLAIGMDPALFKMGGR